MNWKPVLCVAALALVAGCKSQPNPYATFGEYGFTFDLEQPPIPGMTVAENDRISRAPSFIPPTVLTPVVVTNAIQVAPPAVAPVPAAPIVPPSDMTPTPPPTTPPAENPANPPSM